MFINPISVVLGRFLHLTWGRVLRWKLRRSNKIQLHSKYNSLEILKLRLKIRLSQSHRAIWFILPKLSFPLSQIINYFLIEELKTLSYKAGQMKKTEQKWLRIYVPSNYTFFEKSRYIAVASMMKPTNLKRVMNKN